MDKKISRYDAELDLSYGNSAHTQLLLNVKPRSAVLEFGPAAGTMTRYLKEKLDCRVYIVEMDPDAFKAASAFAEGGVCGDAMAMAWKEAFAGVRFDYVLFADILEHVHDPKALLRHAMDLLKDDGVILLSVPNIAHNAVIINLLQNKFEYRKLGLLDESHIRFFTYYSLLETLDGAGLMPVTQDATYMDPPHTEFKNDMDGLDGDTGLLRCRDFDNVYQFVFTAVKKSYYYENKDDIALADNIVRNISAYQGLLYFDTAEGVVQTLFRYMPGSVTVRVNLPPNTRKIIFCPADSVPIVISDMEAVSDGGRCACECANGTAFGNHFLFWAKNPHFVISVPTGSVAWIRIDCKLAFYDTALCGLFMDFIDFMELAAQAENTARVAVAEAGARAEAAEKAAAETGKALSAANAAASQELARFHNTVSWRVTKPLRWVRRLFRR